MLRPKFNPPIARGLVIPRRKQHAFSTPLLLTLIAGTMAVLAMGGGYFLQLNSRLKAAESELRLTKVNQQLLAQEVAMERLLKKTVDSDQLLFSRLAIIPLHSTPSRWQMNVNFAVLWDPLMENGVLVLEGEIAETSAYEMEFNLLLGESPHHPAFVTLPTSAVPTSSRRRCFETAGATDVPAAGFELVMRLTTDPSDAVRFRGHLPRR